MDSIAKSFKEKGGIRDAHYSSCKQKYERETDYVKVFCIKQLTKEQKKFLLENKDCSNKVKVGKLMASLFSNKLPLHRDQVRNFTSSLLKTSVKS